MTQKHTNALINESSPYLLQHAHNPVNWVAWDKEVLERAKKENKPLLISIGYAACHWCHVMEKECFEDEAVAAVMNANFINIKIDREERPDIDHIYMDALQMMTGSGGWPLNIIALPNGKPFWGATYVKKNDWIDVLEELANVYKEQPEKVAEYATNLSKGIREINLVTPSTFNEVIPLPDLEELIKKWKTYLDTYLGGYKRAPKFMMPGNLDFFLHYATSQQDEELLAYVHTTLRRMAYGGIFDHVGGGFSRYAVDTKWHVPHFEKMLYDNGQLISLYAKAYAVTQNDLYKETVEKTIGFITSELMHSSHGFYSSLDADSLNENGQLEEGAFYVWQEADLKHLLGRHFDVFKNYYNINSYGLWEEGNYVLIRDTEEAKIAEKLGMSVEQMRGIIQESLQLLKVAREKRNRPRLDDKILTSWNGLALKGLVDAYKYLENEEYLKLANANAAFIVAHMMQEDGALFHNHKNGKSSISGYLEDYAPVIDAFIALYQVTIEEKWLLKAKLLTDYCIKYFSDSISGLFFFTSIQEDYVIRRTLETVDNAVPSSNSIMTKNLFKLSKFFPEETYHLRSKKMLLAMQEAIAKNPENYANWLHVLLYLNTNFHEIAVIGEHCKIILKELSKEYLPNSMMAGSKKTSELSLLEHRYIEQATNIYVCQHGSCKLPVSTFEEALKLIRE